jgi:hypothetical protein
MKKLDLDECSIVGLDHNGSDLTIKVDDVNGESQFPKKTGMLAFHGVKNIRIEHKPLIGNLEMLTNDGEAIVFRVEENTVEVVVEWHEWSSSGAVKRGPQLIEFAFDSFEIIDA